MAGKLQDKIPKKLKDTLNAASYKGFQLVFEKGSPYLEKTYNKDKLALDFDINDYAMDNRRNKRHFKRLDPSVRCLTDRKVLTGNPLVWYFL